jgi:hypothetical protein
MREFLVELYAARTDRDAVSCDAHKVRSAAEELTRSGTPVRLLRSIFVPEDETCFYLFEAGSIDVVREAAPRAGLEVERVAETVPDDVAADTA